MPGVPPAEMHDNLVALGTLTHPALKMTEPERVTHNVIPGEDTSRPVLVAGRFGEGVFIYSGFRFFKESREQGLGAYRRLPDQELRRGYDPAVLVEAPSSIDSVHYVRRSEIVVVLLNGAGKRPAGEGNHVNIEKFKPIAATVRSRKMAASAFDLPGRLLPVTRSDDFSSVQVAITGAYASVRLVLTSE